MCEFLGIHGAGGDLHPERDHPGGGPLRQDRRVPLARHKEGPRDGPHEPAHPPEVRRDGARHAGRLHDYGEDLLRLHGDHDGAGGERPGFDAHHDCRQRGAEEEISHPAHWGAYYVRLWRYRLVTCFSYVPYALLCVLTLSRLWLLNRSVPTKYLNTVRTGRLNINVTALNFELSNTIVYRYGFPTSKTKWVKYS